MRLCFLSGSGRRNVYEKEIVKIMTNEIYQLLENYMLSCMEDSAHDKEHVYRVLYTALDIAGTETNVDYDVLICACLLHDIGRKEQFENPALCHAQVGAQKAYQFLIEHGFTEAFASHAADCIRTHRYRKSNPPESIEAKILFDADKVDASGTVGIARTLLYKGEVGDPLYTIGADGNVLDGTADEKSSFMKEYKYKLENLYSHFWTKRGEELAKSRQQAAQAFYNSLLREVRSSYGAGQALLEEHLKQ